MHRQDLYKAFLAFIESEAQRERQVVNRRMLSVFFWCFLLPAVVSISILLLVKFGVLSPRLRGLQEWVVLIFPVLYSVYFLGSEVLSELPRALRRGGVAGVLKHAETESQWRERVCEGLRKQVDGSPSDWKWIVSSFSTDLAQLQHRARYLTALAGAVFYLIMQGIDSLGPDEKVTYTRDSMLGWIQTNSSDLNQFIGLALFLVLLYLSGSQNSQFLRRFLGCAELIVLEER